MRPGLRRHSAFSTCRRITSSDWAPPPRHNSSRVTRLPHARSIRASSRSTRPSGTIRIPNTSITRRSSRRTSSRRERSRVAERVNRRAYVSALLLLALPRTGSAQAPVQAPAQATSPAAAARTISTAGVRGHLAFLADDLLQGRAPGTNGGRLAARYIASQLTLMGLDAPSGGYRQPVAIDAWRPDTSRSSIRFIVRKDTIPAQWNRDVIAWAGAPDTLVTLAGDVVFVGYGVRAAEYD